MELQQLNPTWIRTILDHKIELRCIAEKIFTAVNDDEFVQAMLEYEDKTYELAIQSCKNDLQVNVIEVVDRKD